MDPRRYGEMVERGGYRLGGPVTGPFFFAEPDLGCGGGFKPFCSGRFRSAELLDQAARWYGQTVVRPARDED